MSYDLMIWDCDGCLLDSEYISCACTAKHLTRMGYPLSGQDYAYRFAGQRIIHALAEIDAETGKDFSSRFMWSEHDVDVDRLMERDLKPIDGIEGALAKLDLPMCIASGSRIKRNEQLLAQMGILSYFEGHIYSVNQVAKGKPAPDVFLFAAAQMGIDPDKCLVIEDSPFGVMAAKAAGMDVFAYMGASHITNKERANVTFQNSTAIFDNMRELAGMVASAGNK